MNTQVSPEKFGGCPKCLNQQGFVFGTCTDCGWNDIDNSWHFIVVWQLLPYMTSEIQEHAERIAERRAMRETMRQTA